MLPLSRKLSASSDPFGLPGAGRCSFSGRHAGRDRWCQPGGPAEGTRPPPMAAQRHDPIAGRCPDRRQSQRWALLSFRVFRSFRNDAEQQSGRIAHHPPGVRLLDQFGAEFLQPGQFRGWVVGVDVDVHPALPLVETLDQQPQVLTMQRSAVVLGVTVELGQRLAGGRAPERQFTVMLRRRDINYDLGAACCSAPPGQPTRGGDGPPRGKSDGHEQHAAGRRGGGGQAVQEQAARERDHRAVPTAAGSCSRRGRGRS